MSTATPAPGTDWTGMRRSDFDEGAPLALVDARAVGRRVEAATHANGTDALFGDAPTIRPARRAPKPAPAAPQGDSLF